jgi:hypothetical protein
MRAGRHLSPVVIPIHPVWFTVVDSFPVSTLMAPARRGGGASASSAAMGSQMHGHGTSDGSSCQRYRFTEEVSAQQTVLIAFL